MLIENVQIFNEFNARKPDQINIFDGVIKNKLFIGIVGLTLILQVRLVKIDVCCTVTTAEVMLH